jgi:F0F1-type ATP synthase assembly protein I
MSSKDESAMFTIIAYLLSGLLLWGGVGLLLDHLFGLHFLVVIGFMVGLVSAMYLIYLRFIRQ